MRGAKCKIVALAFCCMAISRPAGACALAVHVYTSPPSGMSSADQEKFLAKQEADLDAADRLAEAWRPYREQKSLWENAEEVFVARIESVRPRKLESFWGPFVDIQDVQLIPVSWLKGQGPDQSFTIGISQWSDCGPDKGWDALWGKPGEAFVVFVQGGPPSNKTVRDAIARSKIVDDVVKAALSDLE